PLVEVAVFRQSVRARSKDRQLVPGLSDSTRQRNGVRGVSQKRTLQDDDALKGGDSLVSVGKYLRHAAQARTPRARSELRAHRSTAVSSSVARQDAGSPFR